MGIATNIDVRVAADEDLSTQRCHSVSDPYRRERHCVRGSGLNGSTKHGIGLVEILKTRIDSFSSQVLSEGGRAEVLAAEYMVERSLERFDLYARQLLGDSSDGSAGLAGL